MLVSDSLLVDPHTLDSQDLILLAQPTAIELVIRHDPKKQKSNASRQNTCGKEDYLPRLDDGACLTTTNSNTISKAATKDLRKAVEAEPDTCARALFFLGVPLRCEEGEAGRYRGLEDTEEETDGDCSSIVFHSGKA